MNMKLRWFVISRPLSFSILLAFVALILPSLLIPCWYGMTKHIHSYLLMNDSNSASETPLEIKKISAFLQPINASATKLARTLSSSLNGTQISFFEMKSKIAPLLFEGFSIIPYLTQISYIGLDGFFFSYYMDGEQIFAAYSDPTSVVNSHGEREYIWLTQLVNPETGQLFGNMTERLPMVTTNTTWFQEALKSNHGYASTGIKWSDNRESLFLNTARIKGSNGVVSLGFSVDEFVDLFTRIGHQGKILYLATKEGEVVLQGHPNITMMLTNGSASIQFLEPKEGDQSAHIENISCLHKRDGVDLDASFLKIMGTNYRVYCSPLEILGLQLVHVLLLPREGLANLVHKSSRVTMILLVLIITTTGISLLGFAFIIIRAAKREVFLCAKLIQQMEATQQAERKSMNKSHAFASASHDIRASLAGIFGLIELCHDEATPGSELDKNLKLMEDCTKDLLGILNSILDTSKIEAGKIQLEEEDFHLGQLLEDVIDLYHPVGMKKGIDIVLDPCDGSVIKYSQMTGDRGKLKQILCNLLSNAVKFTFEGHVTVRAWVQKLPSLHNKVIDSNPNSLIRKHSSFLFYKKRCVFEDLESIDNGVQLNRNCVEFIFEVDDTGKGIPKEKQKLVFENYVQVRETALGHGGTGLGLGIVQSLVRLMGGDIAIMDKEIGEKGTCFRFSVLLTISDNVKENVGLNDDASQTMFISRQTLQSSSLGLHSPRSIQISSPKIKKSHVVLFIRNDQRRTICKKFMENLGVKVLAIKQWKQLCVALHQILDKHSLSRHNSRGKSDMSSPSDCLSKSSSSCDSRNWTNMDGKNYLLSAFKKTNTKGGFNFILIVIDASAGPFMEMCNMVGSFKRRLHGAYCRVVWLLENQLSHTIKHTDLESDIFESDDVVFSRPFHGSRLYEVIRLLPEFGGTIQNENSPKDPSSSLYRSNSKIEVTNSLDSANHISIGIQEETKASNEDHMMSLSFHQAHSHSHLGSSPQTSLVGEHHIQHQEIREEKYANVGGEKPLNGKKILVAEDNAVLRKLAAVNLIKLGATVEICENGEEALELVCKGLRNQWKDGASSSLPYDYILMDCEMPIMDGYEATQQIRKVERCYNIHIPIIALTAHTKGEEVSQTIEAGMDAYLGKPLREENLLRIIAYIHCK